MEKCRKCGHDKDSELVEDFLEPTHFVRCGNVICDNESESANTIEGAIQTWDKENKEPTND